VPFKIAGDLSVRKVEDEVFILDRKTAHIHSFNRTGAFLWEMVEKGSGEAEMVGGLMQQFEVDRVTAQKDAAEFIDSLRKSGLVEQQ
jgi:hypothetical protein